MFAETGEVERRGERFESNPESPSRCESREREETR